MRLKILFHDSCFDGAASAALFACFYREHVDAAAQVGYLGLQHRSGDPFPDDAFDGDVNACLDFRLEWWFDHHQSAFVSPADRQHLEADRSGHRFYDPTAKSCTRFLARVLGERFDFDAGRFRELIDRAEIIDGALWPDARTAVDLGDPSLRLMTWIENNRDPALTVRYIEDLQRRRLDEIAADPYIAGPLAPILRRHEQAIALIRERAVVERGVVRFDLIDTGIEAPSKFIAYMLHPEAGYAVGLTRSPARVKISVGSNPWATRPRAHDIARICEGYGGGGHPVVGAVSLPPGEVARAREIAAEIAARLALG